MGPGTASDSRKGEKSSKPHIPDTPDEQFHRFRLARFHFFPKCPRWFRRCLCNMACPAQTSFPTSGSFRLLRSLCFLHHHHLPMNLRQDFVERGQVINTGKMRAHSSRTCFGSARANASSSFRAYAGPKPPPQMYSVCSALISKGDCWLDFPLPWLSHAVSRVSF